MKVLFVALHNPFTSSSGAHQRSLNIIKGLSTFSSVDCLLFGESDIFEENKYDTTDCCETIFYHKLPSSKNKIITSLKRLNPFLYDGSLNQKCIKKIFRDIVSKNKYDRILFRYVDSYMACTSSEDLKNILIDFDDMSWKILYDGYLDKNNSILKRYFNYYRSVISKRYINKIINYPKTINIFANQDDCISGNSKFLNNVPYFANLVIDNHNEFSPKNILFVGYLRYFLNDRAINDFIQNVWDRLLLKHPDATLHIVGKDASSLLVENVQKHPNIKLLGYIEDLSDIYNKCNVAIAPITGGSGTNIKVLEALYMSKICVVSPYAMRGFYPYFTDKKDLFVANNSAEYIEILDRIFSNKPEYQLPTRKGHYLIKDIFSFDRFTQTLKNIVFENN